MINWKAAGLVIAVGGALSLAPHGIVNAQSCTTCTPDNSPRRFHVSPALGIHAGTPQKASVALGVLVGEEWRQDSRDHARNIARHVGFIGGDFDPNATGVVSETFSIKN
jgi:hypothetical protein